MWYEKIFKGENAANWNKVSFSYVELDLQQGFSNREFFFPSVW